MKPAACPDCARFGDGLLPPGWVYPTDIDIEAGTFDDYITRTDGEQVPARRCSCNPKEAPVPDTRTAWRVVETEYDEDGGYVPCLIVGNEPGYTPARGNGSCAAPWYLGTDLDKAKAILATWNLEQYGLDEAAADEVRINNMMVSMRSGATV